MKRGREGGTKKNITLNGNQTHTCTGEKIQRIHCPHSVKMCYCAACVWFEQCAVASSSAVTQVNMTVHLRGSPPRTHTNTRAITAHDCPLTAPFDLHTCEVCPA